MKKQLQMTMKKALILFALFFSWSLVSCGNTTTQASEKETTTVQTQPQSQENQTEAKIINVNADEFEKLIAEKKDAILLDVRTPQEYAEGHIENAQLKNVFDNFDAVAEELAKKYGTDKPVLVYCRSGRRSMTAAQTLKEKGFKTIYNLQGGIIEWTSAGKKVVK